MENKAHEFSLRLKEVQEASTAERIRESLENPFTRSGLFWAISFAEEVKAGRRAVLEHFLSQMTAAGYADLQTFAAAALAALNEEEAAKERTRLALRQIAKGLLPYLPQHQRKSLRDQHNL